MNITKRKEQFENAYRAAIALDEKCGQQIAQLQEQRNKLRIEIIANRAAMQTCEQIIEDEKKETPEAADVELPT